MILEDYFQPLLGIKQTFDFVFQQEKNIISKNAHNVLTYYQVEYLFCFHSTFL